MKQIRLFLSKFNLDKTEISGIINMFLKPVSVVAGLIYVPLLLSYLGREKYGLWATILSFITWINFFDLGIGNGLRNILTSALAKNDLKRVKKAISTAYIAITIIAFIIFAIVCLFISYVNWFNVFSTEVDLKIPLFITALFICSNFVLTLANTILYALQISEQIAIRNLVAQFINIIGILIIMEISKQNITYIAILFGLSQLLVNLGNTFQIMHRKEYLRPSIYKFDRGQLSLICSSGIKFFVIQLMCLLMFTIDDILVTHFWGAVSDTPFSIVNNAFNVIYSFFSSFMIPYWSGTTQALAENKKKWVRTSIRKSFLILIFFVFMYFILAICFKGLSSLWLGKNLDYQPMLIPTMWLFYVLYSILNIESQFISGTGKINFQMLVYIILGASNIPLAISLGVFWNLGPLGVRLATTILVFIADILLGINLKFILKKDSL